MIVTGHSFAQLFYTNGANVTINGAQLQVNGSVLNKGSIQLNQTSKMIVTGDIDNKGKLSNDGYIDLHGNFWSTTKIDNPIGEWNFVGTTIQNLNSDSAFIAKNIVFNNPTKFLLDIKNELKVANTANFVRGIVETINGSKLNFSSTATHSGASDTSHVKGFVSKEGIGNFMYPVGTGAKFQPISVNASTNPKGIKIGYNSANAGTAIFGISGPQSTPLINYNTKENWTINSGGAKGKVNVTHDVFNSFNIITADVRVARKDSSQWLNQGGTLIGSNIESLTSTLDGDFTLGLVKKDISISTINPSSKLSICQGDSLVLNVRRILSNFEFPTTTLYTISPANLAIKVNDTTFKIFPNATTEFILKGEDQTGLIGTSRFNLVVDPLPNVTAKILNPIMINGLPSNIWPKDQSMDFVATGAATYSWSPSTYVNSGINSNALRSTPASHIIYNVIGTDSKGCINKASVSVRVFQVINETVVSCNQLVWRGKTINTSGTYYDSVSGTNVDSIFIMNFKSNAVNTNVKLENGSLISQCVDCSYQWYTCNDNGSTTVIENATSKEFKISTKGSYQVEVSNGICSGKSTCISNNSSSIAGIEYNGISIFPNPVVDKLNIILGTNPVNAIVRLVDLNGKIIANQIVKKSIETSIDVSRYSNGTYFIQIVFENDEKRMYYTKIVKE